MRPIFLVLLLAAASFSQTPGGESTPSFVNEATIGALADVDLRIGGLIRSRYSAAGVLGDEETIENSILAFEPPRMIAIRIERPPKSFPFKEAWKKTWTVITLTDLGDNRTHIRVASMGYGTDEESVAMRRFFEAGTSESRGGLSPVLPLPDGNR